MLLYVAVTLALDTLEAGFVFQMGQKNFKEIRRAFLVVVNLFTFRDSRIAAH
jgi:hypothetical protein